MCSSLLYHVSKPHFSVTGMLPCFFIFSTKDAEMPVCCHTPTNESITSFRASAFQSMCHRFAMLSHRSKSSIVFKFAKFGWLATFVIHSLLKDMKNSVVYQNKFCNVTHQKYQSHLIFLALHES